MKAFAPALLALLFIGSACSPGSFAGATGTVAASEPAVETPEPAAVVTTEGPESPTPEATPAPIASVEGSMEDKAAEPVMVGGAFLVCVQSERVECRLDGPRARNIEPPAGLVLDFSLNGTPIKYTAATVPGYRWRLDPFASSTILRVVQLKITSPNATLWTYRTEFEIQALQIGDGTTALQGCTETFVKQSKMVGLKYEQTYTVPANAPNVMVALVGLCGVARANDSMIQMFDATGTEVFLRYLPITQAIVNLNYRVAGLKPGTYTIRITPGDDIDIDDLFINSLGVSIIAPQ